jgi:hypothetical protein
MSLTRYFTPFCLFLAMFSAVGSAHQDANIQKRSPLFESRQECQNAGWVPICPGKLSYATSIQVLLATLANLRFKVSLNVYHLAAYAARMESAMRCPLKHAPTVPNPLQLLSLDHRRRRSPRQPPPQLSSPKQPLAIPSSPPNTPGITGTTT